MTIAHVLTFDFDCHLVIQNFQRFGEEFLFSLSLKNSVLKSVLVLGGLMALAACDPKAPKKASTGSVNVETPAVDVPAEALPAPTKDVISFQPAISTEDGYNIKAYIISAKPFSELVVNINGIDYFGTKHKRPDLIKRYNAYAAENISGYIFAVENLVLPLNAVNYKIAYPDGTQIDGTYTYPK